MRNFVGNLLLVVSFLLVTGGAFVLGGAFGWGDLWVFGTLGTLLVVLLIGCAVHDLAAASGGAPAIVRRCFAFWRSRPVLMASAVVALASGIADDLGAVAPQNKGLVACGLVVAIPLWWIAILRFGGGWAMDAAQERRCQSWNAREARHRVVA